MASFPNTPSTFVISGEVVILRTGSGAGSPLVVLDHDENAVVEIANDGDLFVKGGMFTADTDSIAVGIGETGF